MSSNVINIAPDSSHLRFFESLDRVNRAMQKTDNLEVMMQDVLDEVLALFDCDRAYLLYPCDPDADAWQVPMECTRPEHPGAGKLGTEIAMDAQVSEKMYLLLTSNGAVKFEPGGKAPFPSEIAHRFGFKSLLAMALYPKSGKPWEFGIQRCSTGRTWSAAEERLLLEIGRRLGDAMTSLLYIRELRDSEAKYRRFVETSTEGVWALDAGHKTTFINARTLELLGRSKEEMIGHSLTDFMFEEDIADHEQRMATRRQGISEQHERRFKHKDGSELWAWVSAKVMQDENGRFQGSFAMLSDITRRKRAEEKLRRSEQRLRLHTELSPLGFLEWDENFRATEWNTACEKIFGYSREEALGRQAKDLILPPEIHKMVDGMFHDLMNQTGGSHSINQNITKDGRTITVEWFNTALIDDSGKAIGIASVCKDITEQNARRQLLYKMAFYDILTELPNRALLRKRLQQMLNLASNQDNQAGLILIDLGRFSEVNDALGHQAGDRLLCLAAERLQQCICDSDMAARLGGDEFAILLPELPHGEDTAQEIATSIKAALDAPFIINGTEVFVSCEIGIAISPQNGADGDTLLKHADSAMRFAKQAGHDNIRFYSKEITDTINQRLRLKSELRHALEREELELYYQPKVQLDDGRLLGSEALIRWSHPEHGLVSPGHFIPVAEESGLILEIGNWVLWEACHTASQWNGRNRPLHKVAVNLSPHQFLVGNLLETVQSVLIGTGCDPAWLELEITESLLLDKDDNIHQLLQSLRDMGLSIAIDDFGTGYSSLSYLANFPINVLKIDRSFTMQATEEGYHAELIKAVCAIARSLNQIVVAEGVETEAQAAILRTFGCHIAQGYLYGKPMPKRIFEQYDDWDM